MTRKMKHMIALFFFKEWTHLNSFLSYRTRFTIYFTTSQAICTPSARVCACLNTVFPARLWMNSFCGSVLHATRAETRQLNSKWSAFYYNSVLIIMLCVWQSESYSFILLLFVLLVVRAEEIITVLLQYSAFTAVQLNQMHLIRDK